MVTKDPTLNRQYVTKSRQKAINTLGIDEYRRRQAQRSRGLTPKTVEGRKQITEKLSDCNFITNNLRNNLGSCSRS